MVKMSVLDVKEGFKGEVWCDCWKINWLYCIELYYIICFYVFIFIYLVKVIEVYVILLFGFIYECVILKVFVYVWVKNYNVNIS